MIGIGIVGYGYWGPNLARNFQENPDSILVAIADSNHERLKVVCASFPHVATYEDYMTLVLDRSVDAVVVSTPVSSHFEIAMAAMKAGKHVFVEKPIADSVVSGLRMVDEASRRGLVLMVDHTFIYSSAVKKMKQIVSSDGFGPVRYFDSTRVNLGLFQDDVNVLWDLAVHDLSIMTYVLDRFPIAVSATGHSIAPGQRHFVGYLTMFFEDLIAHVSVNWLSPVKIRRTLVGGSEKMVVFDDTVSDEKIKVYDKGLVLTESAEDVSRLLVSYRTGDVFSPKLEQIEALKTETSHFLDCVTNSLTPLSSGEEGVKILRILEGADLSLEMKGVPQLL
jgi:predicted dehydrogenase